MSDEQQSGNNSGDDMNQTADAQDLSNISSDEATITFMSDRCDGDFVVVDDADLPNEKDDGGDKPTAVAAAAEENSAATQCKKCKCEPNTVISTPITPSASNNDNNSSNKANKDEKKTPATTVAVDIPAAVSLEQQKESKESSEEFAGGDKNAETDSLIITADDEMELENEIADAKEAKEDVAKEIAEAEAAAKKAEAATSAKPPPPPQSSSAPTKAASNKRADGGANKNVQRFVWVSNINQATTASELKRHFSEYGKIQTAKIVTDGKRCYGHVSFQNPQNVENCVKHLNNTYFEGKKIIVSTAKPEKEQPPDAKKDAGVKGEKKAAKEAAAGRRQNSRFDPLTTVFLEESPEKQTPAAKSACDHDEKLQKETERLRKRLHEEEMKMREERRRQKKREEAHRELEFKLKQERQKLKMERELFEKERQEAIRIDQERRKLEEEKLEMLRYKAKLEEEVRAKKRKFSPEYSRERDGGVVGEKRGRAKSKIADAHDVVKDPVYSRKSGSGLLRSRSRTPPRGKLDEGRYKREDVPKHYIRTPPAPKMTEIVRTKYHQERFPDAKKYYPDAGNGKRSPERKYDDYRFTPKKLVDDRRNPKPPHRDRFGGGGISAYSPADAWKSSASSSIPAPSSQKIGDGWSQVNSSDLDPWKSSCPQEKSPVAGGRYHHQNSPFPFQNYGTGAPRTWYGGPPGGADCHHYDHYGQPSTSLARKY